jgi:hypothetical protein
MIILRIKGDFILFRCRYYDAKMYDKYLKSIQDVDPSDPDYISYINEEEVNLKDVPQIVVDNYISVIDLASTLRVTPILVSDEQGKLIQSDVWNIHTELGGKISVIEPIDYIMEAIDYSLTFLGDKAMEIIQHDSSTENFDEQDNETDPDLDIDENDFMI